jgi:hypothetical protein
MFFDAMRSSGGLLLTLVPVAYSALISRRTLSRKTPEELRMQTLFAYDLDPNDCE